MLTTQKRLQSSHRNCHSCHGLHKSQFLLGDINSTASELRGSVSVTTAPETLDGLWRMSLQPWSIFRWLHPSFRCPQSGLGGPPFPSITVRTGRPSTPVQTSMTKKNVYMWKEETDGITGYVSSSPLSLPRSVWKMSILYTGPLVLQPGSQYDVIWVVLLPTCVLITGRKHWVITQRTDNSWGC
jgi:hypothetical protein